MAAQALLAEILAFLLFIVASVAVLFLEALLAAAKALQAECQALANYSERGCEGETPETTVDVVTEAANEAEDPVPENSASEAEGSVGEAHDGESEAATKTAEASLAYSPLTSPILLSPGSGFSDSSSEGLSPAAEETSPQVPSRRSTGQFLGQGGNGRVFVRGGEAVKVMQAETWEGKLGALLEFQCAQKAGPGSRNLVGACSLTFANGTAEMTMELCAGDLWDLISRIDYETAPPQALEQLAKAFLRQAARGLSALHAEGYVHCDIKPGNVLLGAGVSLQQLASAVQSGGGVEVPAGAFKLSDFGLAMSVAEAQQLERPTGTSGYTAPEMEYLNPDSRQGMDPLPLPTQKADIYSLGCALWEVLTGTQFSSTSDDDWAAFLAPFSLDMKSTLATMMAYYPHERPTAQQIVEHPTLFQAPVAQTRKARARWNLPLPAGL